MDKKLISAIVLAILVMTGYQYIMARFYPVEQRMQQPAPMAPMAREATREAARPGSELLRPVVSDKKAKDIIVETDLFRAIFTTRGAKIKSYRLKNYQARTVKPADIEKEISREKRGAKKEILKAYLREVIDKDANLASLKEALKKAGSGRAIREIENQIRVEEGVELISLDARYHKDYPFNVIFPGEQETYQWDCSIYMPDKEILILGKENKTSSISFRCVNDEGLELIKRFTFFYNSYSFQMDISIKGEIARALTGKTFLVKYGPGIGQPEIERMRRYGHRGPVTRLQQAAVTQIKRESYNRQENTQFVRREYTGEISWVALENKYFIAGLIPGQAARTVVVEKDEEGDYWVALGTTFKREGDYSFGLYLGPKKEKELKALGAGLDEVIDYGIFGPIARLLAVVLGFFYGWTHNYGWAIILLALSTKIVFYPLTHRSFEAMKKMHEDMKVIQPELNELREKYKDNPQKLNKETMSLYKKRSVNPLGGCKGGCLPLLLQMPVFIALYVVLHNSIELRGAPFIWWLSDLSVKDPYYVLPVLMGMSTLIQQRVTGIGGGDAQTEQARMMMWIMPLFLIWIFARFPSGVVLYWFSFNIFTTLQQLLITKARANKVEGGK